MSARQARTAMHKSAKVLTEVLTPRSEGYNGFERKNVDSIDQILYELASHTGRAWESENQKHDH